MNSRVQVSLKRSIVQRTGLRAIFSKLLREREGQELFLLESAGGPKRDVTASFVGIDPVLRVEIGFDWLTVRGQGSLVECIEQQLDPGLFRKSGRERFSFHHREQAWDAIRSIRGAFQVDQNGISSGFNFGFFSCFGYEVARLIEDIPLQLSDGPDRPAITLLLFATILRESFADSCIEVIEARSSYWAIPAIDPLRSEDFDNIELPAVPTPASVQMSMSRVEFEFRARSALEHIRQGDIYQIQIGHEMSIGSAADPWDVYLRLLARNPSPYMFFVRLGDETLIGASPELFVRIEEDEVVMRPIAGTIPRTGNADADVEISSRLSSDEKEIAEHIMLVDLCRNDIGRICASASLVVEELMVVERYSHLLHLVSNVTARKSRDKDSLDVIAATFPAGTMTGAPKVRAMELIEGYEKTRRGYYAGAAGLLDATSDYTNLCLCIRMARWNAGVYQIRASAGIVADSSPQKEWMETLTKLGATFWAITGEELRA